MRLAVKVIAWVYLAAGFASGLRTAHATLFGGQDGDMWWAVLGLLLGYGLLRFHPLARGAALLMSAFCLIGSAHMAALCVGHVAGWSVASGGLIVDRPALAVAALGVAFAFAGGQLWVLTRPAVAALFGGSRSEADGVSI